MAHFLRGARPSPRHRLAAAAPHVATTLTPLQWLWNPKQLSMWLNATYGCCVTAEEAAAKGCGPAGVFITDATVLAWATKNNVLNGTDLVTVLDLMQTGGFAQGSSLYDDGPPLSVDWTNAAILENAISLGPVKIGVAADQLENAVNAGPTQANGNPANGWFGSGFTQDPNEDHCTSVFGFGPIAWLLAELGGTVPAGIDGTKPGRAIFTWGSIGVLDVPSFLAITGEAWRRNPTTLIAAQGAL